MLRPALFLILAALAAGCSDAPPEPVPPPSTPTALALDRPAAAFPTVAVGGEAALLAWTEDGAAFVARWEDGAVTAPARVSPPSDDAVSHGQAPAQIVTGPGNEVYVVYVTQTPAEARRFPTSDLRLARSTDGGRTFSAPVRIHADGWQIDGCPHAGPALAVDDAGRLHAVWYTGAEEHRGVLYAASDDGGRSFHVHHVLASGVPIAQVGAGTNGERVWVAWEDPAEGAVRLARVGPDGGTPEVQIDLAGWAAPSLAVGAGRWVLAGQKEGGLAVETAPVTR